MSADLVRVSAPPSGTATPRSKLDSLTREDLIRFVKKQLDNIKLLKAQNTKLTEQNESTLKTYQEAEEEWKRHLYQARGESNGKIEQLSILKEERDSLLSQTTKLSAQVVELEAELEEMKQQFLSTSIEETYIPADFIAHQEREQWDEFLEESERLRTQLDELRDTCGEQRNEITAMKDLFRDQTEKLVKTEKRLEESLCTVDELRSSLDDTNEQLSIAKQKRNTENVFSLELADYEKSLDKVQKELKHSKEQCESLNEQLEKSRSEGDSIRQDKQRLSTNLNKMKSAIVKLKAEGNDKKEAIIGLEAETRKLCEEAEKRENDRHEEKMEFGLLIGNAEERVRQLETSCASLNRQLVSLRSQRESLQRQYDDLQQEHTTFKTRALYVLEQKRGEEPQPESEDLERFQETIEKQKKTIEHLTQSNRVAHEELCSTREQSFAISAQLQDIEHKLSSAKEVHNKTLKENRAEFESRLSAESKLNTQLLAQIDANFLAHSREKERILEESKKDRDAISTEMEELKKSLDYETKRRKDLERNASPANVAVPARRRDSELVEVKSSYLKRPQSREDENETVDEIEVDRTLEDVLYGDDSMTVVSSVSQDWHYANDVKNWEQIAVNAHKQLEHARELLNESEASNMRLSEQSTLLKDEVRRLERNEQRNEHVANTEYLKNVIMKFLAPEKVSAERGQLIPVLATMLKLSTQEVHLLNKVTEADEIESTEVNSPSWGSYLHRWSGLS